jgi:hypothetical protein
MIDMASCAVMTEMPRRTEVRRSGRRSPASLPILIHLMGRSHSAKLRNLSQGGAMIETDLRLFSGDEIDFKCGGIDVRARIVWHVGASFGLQFISPVAEKDVIDQILRAEFLADRRNLRKALSAIG